MRSSGIAGVAARLKKQQEGSLAEDEAGTAKKAFWAYEVFVERLGHMRDIYVQFHAASLDERKRILANLRSDPSTDPWVSPEDLASAVGGSARPGAAGAP